MMDARPAVRRGWTLVEDELRLTLRAEQTLREQVFRSPTLEDFLLERNRVAWMLWVIHMGETE
jgi:hypothetical protein